MPLASHGGHRTHWTEAGLPAGPGTPAFVLLHCALAHARAWEGLSAHLGGQAHLRAMDLPGHGQSAPLAPGLSAQEQGAAMAWPIVSGIAGGGAGAVSMPVHLVGHSLGGTVALRMALERPEAVASLTLIEPVQFSLLAEAGHPLAAPHFEAEARLEALIAGGQVEQAARAFLAEWGDGPPWEALPPSRRAYVLERMPMISGHGRAMRAGRTGPVNLGALRGLDLPVLIVEGAETPAVIKAIHDVLETTLPSAARLSVPGAGHMVPLTHPEEIATALRARIGDGAEAGVSGAR